MAGADGGCTWGVICLLAVTMCFILMVKALVTSIPKARVLLFSRQETADLLAKLEKHATNLESLPKAVKAQVLLQTLRNI
jgi:hypothetical protein